MENPSRRISGFAYYEDDPDDDCDWSYVPEKPAQSGQWNLWDWFQMLVMVLCFGIANAFALSCILARSLS